MDEAKRRVLFIYANDPEPILLERMKILEQSGRFETHAVYWHRKDSSISIPWSTELPTEKFMQVTLPDPRGNFARRMWFTALFAREVRKAIRTFDPDVLNAVYPDMLATARIANLRQRRRLIVFDLWDLHGDEAPGAIRRWVWRRLLQPVGLMLVSSEEYLRRFFVPNGLLSKATRTVYASNCPLGWAYRRNDRPSSSPLTIGCVGHVRVRDQLANLIAAVGSARETGFDVRLLVAGAGADSEWFRTLAEGEDFIDYHGPFEYSSEAAAIYAKCDLMFAVYPQEQLNYRLHWARRAHQAILSGIPLVVAAGSQMADYVAGNKVGWAVPHDSSDALAKLLCELSSNPAQLAEASHASEAIMGNHKLETYEASILEAYLELA